MLLVVHAVHVGETVFRRATCEFAVPSGAVVGCDVLLYSAACAETCCMVCCDVLLFGPW